MMQTNDSSRIIEAQPSSTNNPGSATASNIESSIEDLVKTWGRRQDMQHKVYNNNPSISNDQNMISNNNNVVAPWRVHLVNFLESPESHIVSIFLLVFDLALSFVELSSSLTPSSCKNGQLSLQAWYHWLGVGILGLLFVKVTLLVVGLGRAFFEKAGYVVDGVVVGVALVLEVVLERLGGGLLLVVSLWRVVRAVESLYELSDDAIEAKIQEVVCQFDVLRDENRRLKEKVDEEEAKII